MARDLLCLATGGAGLTFLPPCLRMHASVHPSIRLPSLPPASSVVVKVIDYNGGHVSWNSCALISYKSVRTYAFFNPKRFFRLVTVMEWSPAMRQAWSSAGDFNQMGQTKGRMVGLLVVPSLFR